MSTVGLIFSNINDGNIAELTVDRALGSVPFAGRYRLIDFMLSNMVNSNITKVGVITKTNYQSLMDHLGSGKDWDLARKSGGLSLLPPFGVKGSSMISSTSRLDALKGVLSYINRSTEDYVVLTDCDIVYNINYNDVVDFLENKKADVALVYKKCELSEKQLDTSVTLGVAEDGRVNELDVAPNRAGTLNQYMKIVVMKRQLLIMMIGEAISHGKSNFFNDILSPSINTMKIYAYEYCGYFANIDSMQDYYSTSMKLLKKDERDKLFNIANQAIYTKVKDSPPTMYGDNSVVKNSLVADGCIIEGEVENSIIFRGAKIGKGAKVKNCIVMQDSYVGERCDLDAVITDKNVIIHDKVSLKGHESLPFYIRKNGII